MKVAVAIDSFKGSLSSYQAAKAIEEGVYAVNPDAEVVIQAVANDKHTREWTSLKTSKQFLRVLSVLAYFL